VGFDGAHHLIEKNATAYAFPKTVRNRAVISIHCYAQVLAGRPGVRGAPPMKIANSEIVCQKRMGWMGNVIARV
jgi:hypothetical protein